MLSSDKLKVVFERKHKPLHRFKKDSYMYEIRGEYFRLSDMYGKLPEEMTSKQWDETDFWSYVERKWEIT